MNISFDNTSIIPLRMLKQTTNLEEEVNDLNATENWESGEQSESAPNERKLWDEVCFRRASHFVEWSSIEVDIHHL